MKDDAEYDLVTVKRSRGGIEHHGRMLGRKISVKTQFHIQEGDFLISKRQIVHGACGFVGQEFDGSIVSNEYSVLAPKPMLRLDYLRYLVHSIYVQQTFFHSSIGVHIEKMIFKLEEWFKWPINLPPLDEQERVAKMFAATDGKLTLLAEKKTALEEYKRGVMQRLFSRALRFSQDDGSAFPDWEERNLGDFVQTFSRGTPTVGRSVFYGGTIPFIKSAEIGRSVTSEFLTEEGVAKSSARMVQEGDFLMALYGANAGEVAFSKIEGAINQAVLCIRSDIDLGYSLHFWLGRKMR